MAKFHKGVDADECVVETPRDQLLVFPSCESNTEGCDYVRIVDRLGVELVYWNADEWKEDPVGVMGAILGAIYGGAMGLPNPRR